MFYGTKGDAEHKRILRNILDYGTLDTNVRAHYKDGEPANTLSYNGEMSKYDLSKGEFPIITLRPIAVRKAIGELLWIYQDQSNSLDMLKDKYGVTWWDPWDIGDRTIGQRYGATVKKHDLLNKLINGIKNDPCGRRHIMSLWQDDDFDQPGGLHPCAFMTLWNVRYPFVTPEEMNEDREFKPYLDMTLIVRSQDTPTAQVINQVQYVVLQHMVAQCCGCLPGIFTYFVQNVHIYGRHIDAVYELLNRKPVKLEKMPSVKLNPEITDFYKFSPEDIGIVDYPIAKISSQNPIISIFREEIAI